LCFIIKPVNAQNIIKMEYFVDTDPGFGNATNVPVTASLDVTANFQVNVTSLSAGFHNLYIRSFVNPYQVTEDGVITTKGGWSLTQVRNFYKEDISVL
jgi:hypothetical protein